MVSKKKKFKNRWISIGSFLGISAVLLINNTSDLFSKFGLFVPIQWITWGGLVGVVLYTIWMASEDKI